MADQKPEEKKGLLKWEWLNKVLEERGITRYALKTKHHFNYASFDNWDKGTPARPHSIRKLAAILELEYSEVVDNLGVEVQGLHERRERMPAK